MRRKIEGKIWCPVLLMLLIVFQLAYTTWVFSGKEVFYADENWCYGLANSYYQPHLFLKDGIYLGDFAAAEYVNLGEWVSGETFRRYITVQEEERFAYASVYHNQTLDSHPPLYYFLLHTVCSFFPEQFSWWYGFFLSGIFLVGTQVFLYLLAEKVMRSPWKALLCCLLYGVGNGALMTFTFIRQYSLLTMLCMAFTYSCACVYEACRTGDPWRRRLLGTVVLAFCGFFTHYYAIVYIGAFTAVFCLWLLWTGRLKRCLQFGFCMAGTLGAFLLLYPAFLMQAASDSVRKLMYLPFSVQYKMILNFILETNLGISVEPWASPFLKILFPLLLFILFCLCLLCIPFRREPWMAGLLSKLRGCPARLLSRLKPMSGMQGNPIPCCVLIAILVHCGVVNLTCNLWKMGVASIRYVFSAFPLCCFVTVCLADWALRKVCRGRTQKAVLPLLACLTLFLACGARLRSTPYLVERQPQAYQQLSELLRDRNCLFLQASASDFWLLVNECADFRYADHVFATYADMLDKHRAKLYDGTQVDYVLVESKVLQLDAEEKEMEAYWWKRGQTDEKRAEGMSMGASPSLENADPEKEKEKEKEETPWMNEDIRALNGGCDYDILFGFWLNGEPFYVLELK